MYLNYSKFIFLLIFLFIITFFSFKNYNGVEFTYWVIGIQCILALFYISNKQKVSFFHIFYFFSLLFFFLVPSLQYQYNKFLHIDIYKDYETIFYINILIISWNALYFVFYQYFYNKEYQYVYVSNIKNNNIKILNSLVIYVILFIILYSTYSLNIFLSRESVFTNLNQQLALIYAYYFKPLVFFTFMFYIIQYKFIRRSKIIFLFLFIFLIIYNFPTSIARFYLFAIVLAAYIAIIMKRNHNSYIFTVFLSIGILFSAIFGFLRNIGGILSNNLSFSSIFNVNYFFVGNFDAYENFLLTIYYVEEQGIKFGENIFSVLLFFIPRFIWENKPMGSGVNLAEYLNTQLYSITNINISQPLISEFYISFHFFGILVGTLLFGYITGKLDSIFKYLILEDKNISNSTLLLIYGSLIGLFFFMLRGDLLSSFAYTIGILFAYYTTLKIFGIKLLKETN